MEKLENYGLDLHSTMILEEYRENLPVFEKMREIVTNRIRKALDDNGILVTALESRIKTEKSLAGKLEIKGYKYNFLSDLTDILGCRVITFYTDEVDKIATLMEKIFHIDWQNSVDKRKMHQLDSFGYMSLHYICTIPKSLYSDPQMPQLNELRFEVQMRTALQHVWANMNHDTGYKSGVEVPYEYLRNLNRLAGMLELADEQFSRIRSEITSYRRQVSALVSSGRFEDVRLDGDTFRSYLELKPFDKLLGRIAAINQAEIHPSSILPYFKVLKAMQFETLGDIDRMVKEDSDDAYQLALHELAATDLDIISSTLAIQDLCVVHLMKQKAGEHGLAMIFEILNGPNDYNGQRAHRVFELCSSLTFMNDYR